MLEYVCNYTFITNHLSEIKKIHFKRRKNCGVNRLLVNWIKNMSAKQCCAFIYLFVKDSSAFKRNKTKSLLDTRGQ